MNVNREFLSEREDELTLGDLVISVEVLGGRIVSEWIFMEFQVSVPSSLLFI